MMCEDWDDLEDECWECGSCGVESWEKNMSSHSFSAQQVMEILWDFERALATVALDAEAKTVLRGKFSAYYIMLKALGGKQEHLPPAHNKNLL